MHLAVKLDVMSILIVEDNPMILKSLTYLFSKSEYKVLGAVDGLQAKAFFDDEKPSLVISDILLPFLTGLELIEHIRDTEKDYTKILVLSSLAMEDTICQAFELGIDDYMVKPFIASELIARTKRLLKYTIN